MCVYLCHTLQGTDWLWSSYQAWVQASSKCSLVFTGGCALHSIDAMLTLFSSKKLWTFHFKFQERLLLSLLPAHIAMEMKAEIIQRLQGPKAGQLENTNNFHNLYVKRHTNVRYCTVIKCIDNIEKKKFERKDLGRN